MFYNIHPKCIFFFFYLYKWERHSPDFACVHNHILNNTHKNKRIFSSDLDKSYRREKRVDHSYFSSVHVKSIFFFFNSSFVYVSIKLLILNSQHRSTLRLQVIVNMEGVFSLGYKNRYCMKRLVWSENFFFFFRPKWANVQACKYPVCLRNGMQISFL